MIEVPFNHVIRRTVRFGVKAIDFEVNMVAGEEGAPFEFKLVDLELNPIDLTDKTVKLEVKSFKGTSSNAVKDCQVVDALQGLVSYRFGVNDLTEEGTYFGDLVLIDSQGQQTAPQFLRIIVRKSHG